LERFLTWTTALADFVQQRLVALDEDRPTAFPSFLASLRFSILPPEDYRGFDFVAWLLAIPAVEREAVLEFLHLGPVRAEVVRAALTIAQVESAVRHDPRLSSKQLADCIANLEESPTELSEILVRELVAPRLTEREQQQFAERLKLLRGQKQRRRSPFRSFQGRPATESAPFFASPSAYGERLERSHRRAALELLHSLWRAGILDDEYYRRLLGQFWRRPETIADKWDRDRRRPSLVEQMIRFADQVHAAAVNAGDPPPSIAALVWGVWSYLKADENIAARWRAPVPSGQRRESRTQAPPRIEADDPGEIIEHIGVSLMKWFDLVDVVARARVHSASIDETELGDVRAVDLLLFGWFGEEGMLLPAAAYAAPLATAVRQGQEVLQPLAAHDTAVERLCNTLAVLAPFYAQYQGWAESLDFGDVAPAETIARWRDLLLEVRTAARRLSRAKTLAGDLHGAWQAAAELLTNQQQLLRLQLAMRVAVERDDPACRNLCASHSLLAQLDAQRVGLARRRRFHPRSEAAIIADKLRGRVQAILSLSPAQPCLQAEAVALAADCQSLLALHVAPANAQRRKLALACADRIDQRVRELRSTFERISPTARRREDEPIVDAALSAARTARDLADGFFAAKQHKGLRTLVPRRQGDRLDDTLSRV
jgi:hypothetical protein